MQRVTIRCRDKRHLQEFWRERFSGSNFFLPTATPYAIQTEFPLLVRTMREEVGILLRARVTQVIEGPTASAGGMMGEIVMGTADRDLLEDAITEVCRVGYRGILDFSTYKRRPASASTAAAPRPAAPDALIVHPLFESSFPPNPSDGRADLEKAKTLGEAAQHLLDAGEYAAAASSIRLALQIEPGNPLYRSRQREIARQQYHARQIQEAEHRRRTRGKDTDGWMG